LAASIDFWFIGFAGRKLSSEVCQPLLDIETTKLRIALRPPGIRRFLT
jgi:hypothetical protein